MKLLLNSSMGMNIVWDFVNTGIQSVFLWIDSVVYWFASQCYQLFIKLAGTKIFEDSFFANFANRIYVILGVFMLFYLAYALLNAIVDPEKLTKGDKGVGKIATNLIVSLVILGFLPTIFSYAYRLQNYILASNAIGSLILGTPVQDVDSEDNSVNDNEMLAYGDVLSFTILNTFLNPDNINFNVSDDYTWYNFKNDVLEYGDYSAMPNMGKAVSTGVNALSGEYAGTTMRIDYKVVISTAAGVFLIYVMLSFTLDLGVRVVKLAFYQLIAPIPVIMRILPSKKNTFDKWLKQTLSVYFEVFVRVAIMYIAIYFINTIVNNNTLKQFWEGGLQGKLALVIIILGIFAFAKQAPKMISDLLGIDTGGLKLGIKDKLKASGFLGNAINNGIGRVVGATTGAVGAGISGFANGAGPAGFLYGAANGWKNKGMQFSKQRQDMYSKLTGDYKGKVGLFGGQSFGTKIFNRMGGLASEIAIDQRTAEIKAYEDKRIKGEREAYNEQINALKNQYSQEKSAYDAETQNLLSNLTKKYNDNESRFNANNSSQLASLTKKRDQEEAEFNRNRDLKIANLRKAQASTGRSNRQEYYKLENEILDLQKSQYENTSLDNQINGLRNASYAATSEGQELQRQIEGARNRVYVNDELQRQIDNSIFDEDAIRSRIKEEKELINDLESKKYHANVKIANRLGEMKATKQQQEAFDKVLKDYVAKSNNNK